MPVVFRCPWFRALAAATTVCLSCGSSVFGRGRGGAPDAVSTAARDNSGLLKRRAEAVAVIETDTGRGLGFVIDAAGHVLTNRHVVENASYVRLTLPEARPPRVFEQVQIEYIDPVRDLALLRVHPEADLSRIPLALGRGGPISGYASERDPVILTQHRLHDRVGHIGLRTAAITTLTARNPAAGPGAFIGVDVGVVRGQSGGPVLDRRGRAIGIVTWTWRDRVGGYAIPIGDAARMLAERPRLRSRSERVLRAQVRSRAFLHALGRGDVVDARRFTSPSRARRMRQQVVERMFERVEDGRIQAVLEGFIGAVEALVVEAQDEARYDRLREIVARTGARHFMDTIGGVGTLDATQVVSFFYEIGQAYLAARTFGEQAPQEAFATAIRRLDTIDASRTFVLAELLTDLSGREIQIAAVEEIPGLKYRRALVSLQIKPVVVGARMSTAGAADRAIADSLVLHMRLEWGDWYVVAVAPYRFAAGVPSALAG